MFGLLAFHEITARRGDGLRSGFFRLLPAGSLREGLTLIPGGLAETNQPSLASDTGRDGRLLSFLRFDQRHTMSAASQSLSVTPAAGWNRQTSWQRWPEP